MVFLGDVKCFLINQKFGEFKVAEKNDEVTYHHSRALILIQLSEVIMVIIIRRTQVRLARREPTGHFDIQEPICHAEARFQLRSLLDVSNLRRQLRAEGSIHFLIALINVDNA